VIPWFDRLPRHADHGRLLQPRISADRNEQRRRISDLCLQNVEVACRMLFVGVFELDSISSMGMKQLVSIVDVYESTVVAVVARFVIVPVGFVHMDERRAACSGNQCQRGQKCSALAHRQILGHCRGVPIIVASP
jgi:hypothetical protein